MRFRSDDFPRSSKNNSELTDTIESEHLKGFVAVAEEQIRAMHSHEDGSSVELHQVGSREFIQQSIQTSLEGKLGGSEEHNEKQFWQKESESPFAAAKIEYEKKSSQSQPQQLYGAQQSVTGVSHSQETAMVGCNCGAEWTVTGQSTKAQGAEGVKVEQYGTASGQLSGYRASGAGGEKAEYRTSAGQQQGYKG